MLRSLKLIVDRFAEALHTTELQLILKWHFLCYISSYKIHLKEIWVDVDWIENDSIEKLLRQNVSLT